MTTPVRTDSTGRVRVENLVTSGTFSLDGGTWDVDNNVWIVGDDAECVVIDPAHDAAAVVEAVAGRRVVAVLLTHGHDDHIRAVRDVAAQVGAPVHLNPADTMLWEQVYPGTTADEEIVDGKETTVAGVTLTALHTPGHSPGSTCFHAPDLGEGGVLFSGDTLFSGGPGATGRSYSDFPTIIESIRERILTLPGSTEVLTGHGDATSVGAEKPHLQEWVDRGH
ncbi:Glyoxylase, beta-lactamase superfamily II [Georgenia satyanarayanai]|uniref:Glyoxylase, beta-lactamase superfamily II n=1 Tax=Georgenia satyanarayanai TaxID=860221 RepID=A0A2Y9ABG7_9MICO|nr:MBL fold metallo-hydrolase [Georgenia satyanarayanai]PYF99938.1 glyoxylase-like metal-dependent hydrolase (beta-lactamase superfamily II) [Georgenia satyanarayanai]SSA41941.1 Glyoxylase, beta-lactamase superfamily II [Georgenia satyanarayanai]